MKLTFKLLTKETWQDFEALLGPYNGCKGCWCMNWRLSFSDWKKQQGEGNRQAMKSFVDRGDVPGMLAFESGRPVAWCAFGPRKWYPRLNKSSVTKPIDDEDVVAITCFFVERPARKKGIPLVLLQQVCQFAKEQGAKIIEGYPVEPGERKVDATTALVGIASTFEKARFKEVARRKSDRPIMRRYVE
jgi:GNAT superfamily N-acetyltransferase